MKIGILSPLSIKDLKKYLDTKESLPTGLECTIITQLIEYYLEQGHEVVIATVTYGMHPIKMYRGKNLTVFVGNYRKYGKIRAVTKFSSEIRQMANFFKENPCDVYHAHWEYEFALAALKVNKDKTLVTIHDWPYAVYEQMHDYYRKKRLQMGISVFQKATYFTCVSQYIAKLFLGIYNDKENRIIGNCIKSNDIFTEIKTLNKNPVIITANNGFNELKNTQATIHAFSIVKDKIKDSELHMYGQDYEKDGKAYLWARKNGFLDGIVFHGYKKHDEFVKALRQADLLIHSSREESFGMSIVEAMINKVPVIAGKNSGGVPEILQNGKLGILVDVENINEISNEVINILNNEACWDGYVNNAYIQARNEYTSKSIGSQYLRYYQYMIDNKL